MSGRLASIHCVRLATRLAALAPKGGQAVIDMRRHNLMRVAQDKPVTLQQMQGLGQHAFRHAPRLPACRFSREMVFRHVEELACLCNT